jgi:hypothetical protein
MEKEKQELIAIDQKARAGHLHWVVTRLNRKINRRMKHASNRTNNQKQAG